jgi:hypothetical protein
MRLRPRFTLRTLLISVAAFAVVCWIWVSWPTWRFHFIEAREQSELVEAIKTLKIGDVPYDALQHFPWPGGEEYYYSAETSGHSVEFSTFNWSTVTYCLYFRLASPPGDGAMQDRCTSVEAFRVPTVPSDYRPRLNGRHLSVKPRLPWKGPDIDLLGAYLGDFFDVLVGDRARLGNFPHEMIYCDPPK